MQLFLSSVSCLSFSIIQDQEGGGEGGVVGSSVAGEILILVFILKPRKPFFIQHLITK